VARAAPTPKSDAIVSTADAGNRTSSGTAGMYGKRGTMAATTNAASVAKPWNELSDRGALVTTSTEDLAQRLGRALEKAYDGRVRYGFSRENKIAHIWWSR
jgi:hypothetical protein